MTLELRAPRESEWRSCRMLLPETFADAERRVYLLGIDAGTRRIVGAASFRRVDGTAADFRINVVPAARRRGVGSEIVARVAAEHSAIEGTSDITREAAVEAFCGRNGFARLETLTTVEAELGPMREFLGRLRRRLPLPDGVRIASLAEAPLDQVAALHAQHVAHDGDENDWRARVAESPEMARSVVVMNGDSAAGILLWTFEGSTAVVRSRVVAPGLRGGWVNALLMAEAMERGCASGAARVRFFYSDTNRDTEKLASRFRAEVTGILARFRRAGYPGAGDSPKD